MTSNSCAASSCKNDRRYKERLIIMPGIQTLKFHGPRENVDSWTRKLEREDKSFKLSAFHTVCSNHFVNRELPGKKYPTLYLRKYPHWARKHEWLKKDILAIDDSATKSAMIQYIRLNIFDGLGEELDKIIGFSSVGDVDYSPCMPILLDSPFFQTIQGLVQQAFAKYMFGTEFPNEKICRKRKRPPAKKKEPPFVPEHGYNIPAKAFLTPDKSLTLLQDKDTQIRRLNNEVQTLKDQLEETNAKISKLSDDNHVLKQKGKFSVNRIKNDDDKTLKTN